MRCISILTVKELSLGSGEETEAPRGHLEVADNATQSHNPFARQIGYSPIAITVVAKKKKTKKKRTTALISWPVEVSRIQRWPKRLHDLADTSDHGDKPAAGAPCPPGWVWSPGTDARKQAGLQASTYPAHSSGTTSARRTRCRSAGPSPAGIHSFRRRSGRPGRRIAMFI